jgi:Secretion system C-terminal sorting domain
MKYIFTSVFFLFTIIALNAQVCTQSNFDACTGSSAITSDFRNGVQIAGTGSPLTVGAKYKFNYAIPGFNLDAVISIDAMVNATMSGATNPAIDDDAAVNETNIAGTQAGLFAPRIAPNQILSCNNVSGYVEFSIKFYTHYSGNGAPASSTEIAVSNLNYLHFDMDGNTQGNNGWYRKTSYVKMNGTDPVNYSTATTELSDAGNTGDWLLTYGGTIERNGVSRCGEVIQKSIYFLPQTAISFRMGYDYKAPSLNCNSISYQPTKQYGAKFGCFTLPAAGPLPVSITDLAVNYNNGKTNIVWTSLQEHNLDSYEIQRSIDGINFEVAGFVKANNLTSVQQYKFTDNVAALTSKYIFYRVRIVDMEHSMKLTNIVSVKIADWLNGEMIISPNPSSTNAQLKIKMNRAAVGDITVFDAAGKIVLKQQASLLAGKNTVVINNITTLNDGYYTVRLNTNNEIFSTKLLVWK